MRAAVLAVLHDERGRILLLRRRKRPNRGCWSPIGGKIQDRRGESPHEAVRREVFEETGVRPRDLRLAGILTERRWEGREDWLVFSFRGRLPRAIRRCPEGDLRWFTRKEVRALPDRPPGMRYFWRRMLARPKRQAAPARPFILTIEGRARGSPRIRREE